ncbi:TPA: hypothetical protein L5D31_005557 [Pseudomonas aeruginosa]|nr:hypothetical protein [Pseudomonas aeruginosa]
MTDINRLKVLAERADALYGAPSLEHVFAITKFREAVEPKAILGLIAEVERLRSRLEIDERIPHDGISCRDETIKALDEKCDKLKAENDALRKFSAEAYQVLGALDAPENVLDNASHAANGVPLRHETLLPFFAEDYEALRKDAARYRALRQKERGDVIVRDRVSHLIGEHLDAAIDAAEIGKSMGGGE